MRFKTILAVLAVSSLTLTAHAQELIDVQMLQNGAQALENTPEGGDLPFEIAKALKEYQELTLELTDLKNGLSIAESKLSIAESNHKESLIKVEETQEQFKIAEKDMIRFAVGVYKGESTGDDSLKVFSGLLQNRISPAGVLQQEYVGAGLNYNGSKVDNYKNAKQEALNAKQKAEELQKIAENVITEIQQKTMRTNQAITEQENKLGKLKELMLSALEDKATREALELKLANMRQQVLNANLDPTKLTINDLENMTTELCSTEHLNTSFPNGQIPDYALCPLTIPGHKLRPHAARAFNAMNEAYKRDHNGQNICITDSYRPYHVQVILKQQKPFLAARPGTSNHGWGYATDLCGGINNFGTPEHTWMRANAPLFGFYHPSWAQINGSKPEPWHWEYIATKKQ